LTKPVSQPQINTLEDICSSTFPIFTYREDLKTEFINVLNNLTNEDWSTKVFALPFEKLVEELLSYNTTSGYILTQFDAEILVESQKHLNLRGYHIPQVTITIAIFSYKVNENFLFFERLNEICFRIESAGLWDLWFRRWR